MRWKDLDSKEVVHNMRERFFDLLEDVATAEAFYEIAENGHNFGTITRWRDNRERAETKLKEFMYIVDYLGLDSDKTRLVYGRRQSKIRRRLKKRYMNKYYCED